MALPIGKMLILEVPKQNRGEFNSLTLGNIRSFRTSRQKSDKHVDIYAKCCLIFLDLHLIMPNSYSSL